MDRDGGKERGREMGKGGKRKIWVERSSGREGRGLGLCLRERKTNIQFICVYRDRERREYM